MTTDQCAELRRRAGLTQEEIGKRLGLARWIQERWRAAEGRPPD